MNIKDEIENLLYKKYGTGCNGIKQMFCDRTPVYEYLKNNRPIKCDYTFWIDEMTRLIDY